jgi:hypothetical protein
MTHKDALSDAGADACGRSGARTGAVSASRGLQPPTPWVPSGGLISCGAAASRDFRVFYFLKNPFRFVSEGVGYKDFNSLGLELPKCPPLVSQYETAILFGSEGV